MKTTRWMMAALMLAGVALTVLPARSMAEMPEASVQDSSGDPGGEIDRWFGVIGAALCGGEMWLIRVNPVLGLNPGPLAAGIAGCALAILDVATT